MKLTVYVQGPKGRQFKIAFLEHALPMVGDTVMVEGKEYRVTQRVFRCERDWTGGFTAEEVYLVV